MSMAIFHNRLKESISIKITECFISAYYREKCDLGVRSLLLAFSVSLIDVIRGRAMAVHYHCFMSNVKIKDLTPLLLNLVYRPRKDFCMSSDDSSSLPVPSRATLPVCIT